MWVSFLLWQVEESRASMQAVIRNSSKKSFWFDKGGVCLAWGYKTPGTLIHEGNSHLSTGCSRNQCPHEQDWKWGLAGGQSLSAAMGLKEEQKFTWFLCHGRAKPTSCWGKSDIPHSPPRHWVKNPLHLGVRILYFWGPNLFKFSKH